MKSKLGIVFLMVAALIYFVIWYGSEDASIVNESFSAQQISSSKSVSIEAGTSPLLSSSGFEYVEHKGASIAVSSVKSLSGVRVDPLPEIANFLRQLDSAIIPKIYLPTPNRDSLFDYGKAKPLELKEKALAGDPYAAYFYAEYIARNRVRVITDKGGYAYETDAKKRIQAMTEAREYYIRGFRGGIGSIADVLSRLYAIPYQGGNRIESLAWRKISFAVGESERYNCLRNSTMCVVKDFNNLNRLEYFYPCLSNLGDSCTQNEYDFAMTLALEYADSLEFAMNNKVGQ